MKLLKMNENDYVIVSDDYTKTVEVVIKDNVVRSFNQEQGEIIKWFGWVQNNKEQMDILFDTSVVREAKK